MTTTAHIIELLSECAVELENFDNDNVVAKRARTAIAELSRADSQEFGKMLAELKSLIGVINSIEQVRSALKELP